MDQVLSKQPPILLRPATSADIPAITRIYDRIHEEEQAGRLTIGWAPGVYPVQATAEAGIARGDLYVAEVDGEVLASAILNHNQVDCYRMGEWKYVCPDEQVLVMHTLAVDPDHFQEGIGGAFIRYYEELGREMGCLALRLDTQAKNARARIVYPKFGYREVGIVPCEFNGIQNVQLVLLEKSIADE